MAKAELEIGNEVQYSRHGQIEEGIFEGWVDENGKTVALIRIGNDAKIHVSQNSIKGVVREWR